MSRAFQWTLIFLLSLLVLLLAYRFAPKHLRYELEDTVARHTAPSFQWSLAMVGPVERDKLVQEYESRGFQLRCFDGLRDHEKIAATDDAMCWAIISSAYENIPARMVSFFFKQNTLSYLRLEFPDTAAPSLKGFLMRALHDYPRVDQLQPEAGKGVDGEQLLVWETRTGLVITEEKPVSGRPIIVLWQHMEGEPRYLR